MLHNTKKLKDRIAELKLLLMDFGGATKERIQEEIEDMQFELDSITARVKAK